MLIGQLNIVFKGAVIYKSGTFYYDKFIMKDKIYMKDKKNQIIKSAGGIVIRKDRNTWKVVLLFKNQNWVLPKGRIKMGETEKDTALREVNEETGIPLDKLEVITRLGKLYYIDHLSEDDYFPRPKVVTYFLLKTDYKEIRPLKAENFQKAFWFNLEEGLNKLSFLESKAMLFRGIKETERLERKFQKIDTIVVPVGGKGKRMGINHKSKPPKLLLKIHGQPFLKFLLDNLIKIKFKKIYLLMGHHQKEIKKFVKENYKKQEIRIINGGTAGILPAVSKIKNFLKKPFIYHDGNVISHSHLLEDLRSPKSLEQSIIKLSLSPRDFAPTHLQVILERNKIKEVYPRINYYQKNVEKIDDIFCSMGIMAVDNRIFKILSDFEKFNDWDLLVDFLFKTKLNTDVEFIDFLRYNDDWYCIHTKKDIKLIERKSKFFRFLTINKEVPK